MDTEALRAAVHGVTKSRTPLSNWTELNEPDTSELDSCFDDCGFFDSQGSKSQNSSHDIWSENKTEDCISLLILFPISEDIWP